MEDVRVLLVKVRFLSLKVWRIRKIIHIRPNEKKNKKQKQKKKERKKTSIFPVTRAHFSLTTYLSVDFVLNNVCIHKSLKCRKNMLQNYFWPEYTCRVYLLN